VSYNPHPLFAGIDEQSAIHAQVETYLAQAVAFDCRQEYQHAVSFLLSYSASPETFKSYRREVERLLQWCWFEAHILLRDMDREVFEAYLAFAFSPPGDWVASKSAPRFIFCDGAWRANAHWRPYLQRASKVEKQLGVEQSSNYNMRSGARKALFAGVSTFCTYLLQENYLSRNPVALLRQKSRFIVREQQTRITRKLTDLQWYNVLQVVEKLAKTQPKYERHVFLLSCFYLLGVRISELATTPLHTPTMQDFSRDEAGRWWFTVIGKGNKRREIAVPDMLLAALKRYRLSRQLTPLPLRGESSPLLHNYKNAGGLSIRQIRTLIQECFDKAIATLLEQQQEDAAHDLMAATVHWLRHTAISADVQHRPRDHVRDDAGHESISTTDRYIDIDRAARHDSARYKSIIPEQYKEC